MILVGTPAYDGKMEWKTISSLVGLGHLCAKANIGYAMDVIPGDAFVDHSRNLIAHRFLKGGFRDLLFVDADVSFHPLDAAKLCQAEPELVCGLYRMKTDKEVYPARIHEPLETHPSDPDLIRLLWGPAGFMRIRASVFEKMIEKWPDDWYQDSGTGEKVYDFFPAGRRGHSRISEDVSFCEKAANVGVKLYAMQGIALQHTGVKAFPSNWQMTKPVIEEANGQG